MRFAGDQDLQWRPRRAQFQAGGQWTPNGQASHWRCARERFLGKAETDQHVGVTCYQYAVTLDVPDDAPLHRFMRYVRPPADRTSAQREAGPLFPLRPSTRKLRVAVDVQTLGEPTPELVRVLARDEEVEPLLLVQNDESEPTRWMQALGCRR
jgi:hypothetical protein